MWVQHLGRAAIEAPHQAVGLGHWVFSHPMVNPQRLVHLVELTRSCWMAAAASKKPARELLAVVGEDGVNLQRRYLGHYRLVLFDGNQHPAGSPGSMATNSELRLPSPCI